MRLHELEGLCAIHALMLWEFNVAPCEIIKAVYGDSHNEGYLKEKIGLLADHGILYLFGQLDGVHRQEFIEAMYDAYGDEAKRAVNYYAVAKTIEGDKNDAPY
jgi:hypothetical protein